MDAKAEKVALFRYGMIAPPVLEPLPRGAIELHGLAFLRCEDKPRLQRLVCTLSLSKCDAPPEAGSLTPETQQVVVIAARNRSRRCKSKNF